MPGVGDTGPRDMVSPGGADGGGVTSTGLAGDRPSASAPSGRGVVLSTRRLSKQYGPFRAVSDVDLDIHEHDIHVFIGPNGAGKSTVLNMLGGQILPSAGEVCFDGRPLGRTTPSWRARAGIGRSFQLTSIIPGF